MDANPANPRILPGGYLLRCLTANDNAAMAEVIRTVSSEFGLSAAKGYGVADPNLDNLNACYPSPDACYWVICVNGHILGGAGIAPLAGVDAKSGYCELQKMYFLPTLRGKAIGKLLVQHALTFARQRGYRYCYLETTAPLKGALKLYLSLGFQHLPAPLGHTGHDACELPMLLTLTP